MDDAGQIRTQSASSKMNEVLVSITVLHVLSTSKDWSLEGSSSLVQWRRIVSTPDRRTEKKIKEERRAGGQAERENLR